MFFKNEHIKILLFSFAFIILLILLSAYFTNYSTFYATKGKKPRLIGYGEWMEYSIKPTNQTIFYYSLGGNCYNVKIKNSSFDYCVNETGVFPEPVILFYLPVLPSKNSPAYYAYMGNISGNTFLIDETYFYYIGETEYMGRSAYIIKTNKNYTYLVNKEKEIVVFAEFGSMGLELVNSSFLQKAE